MKTKYTALVAFAFSMLFSCVSEERLASHLGMVQVEISERGMATRVDEEVMNTVRLIVFTDLDTAAPRAEINRMYGQDEFTVIPGTATTPSTVKFVLRVERSDVGSNEKLIVAVLNEPNATEMKTVLDAIDSPDDLEGIDLEMSYFVDDSHLSLKQDAMIPMTGVLRTDELFSSESEASRAGNVLTLPVHRAVARVDVYLKNETGVESGIEMAAGSTVTLNNSCTKGNLFYFSDGEDMIGEIPTVTGGFVNRSWTYTSTTPTAISETTPVCTFYTPERTHTANRLKLDIDIDTSEGATRSGSLELIKAKDADDVEHNVDDILRNHIYKITVTVGANGITGDVVDWNDKNVNTEF